MVQHGLFHKSLINRVGEYVSSWSFSAQSSATVVWLPRPFAERKRLASVVSKSCTTSQGFVRANQIAEARHVVNLSWIFISYTRQSAMTDTSGRNRVRCTPTGLREFKEWAAKGRGWNYRRKAVTFCSATSRVQEEPVLCVFACSVWPAVSKWRHRGEAPGTYSGCYSANSNHGRIQDQVYRV